MAFNQRVAQTAVTSGTLNGVVAGTTTAGPTFTVGEAVLRSISCLATVEAETTSLTMTVIWQVSNDQTTWYTAVDANNVTPTVLATGTGGDDAIVTKVIGAPIAVNAWRFCRVAILSAGATGAVTDTYSFRYSYLRPDFT